MCSLNSSLVEAEWTATLTAAAADVVAQSFFADTEPAPDWADDGAMPDDWLAATVRFEEAGCAGALHLFLPDALAWTLLDAFTGRGPSDPLPPYEDVCDLVGELSNMICGAWLTRLASHQAFALSRPVVGPVLDRATVREVIGSRLTMRVNDLPLILDVEIERRNVD